MKKYLSWIIYFPFRLYSLINFSSWDNFDSNGCNPSWFCKRDIHDYRLKYLQNGTCPFIFYRCKNCEEDYFFEYKDN
jgi:hypothetical protein